MGILTKMEIPQQCLQDIYRQAEQEYPNECCGMILGPETEEGLSRIHPCQNVQDEYHAKDPENFPRTAKTAYFIAPQELLKIEKDARNAKEKIRVIYHSHIDAGAYFSEEDKRVATSEGEPTYPGVYYLVVSVEKGKVKDSNLFHWDSEKKDFIS